MGQYGKVDGCALFYNTNKLQVVDYFDIDFNEEARSDVKHNKLNEQQVVHIYIHTNIHTYIHTCMHTNIQI